ncbi:MAG: methyltransferase [Archaeoglobaceae archaeon]
MQKFVYEPAEDSELLAEVALREVEEGDEVIEIGAGSGFVAEKLLNKCRSITVTEISPIAAKVLKAKNFDVIVTDIAAGIKKKFSLVLFNPPYVEIEEEIKKGDLVDLAIDGGKHGVEVIAKFLRQLPNFLKEDGRAILIASSINEPYVFDLIKDMKLKFEVVGMKKLFFERLYAIKITF